MMQYFKKSDKVVTTDSDGQLKRKMTQILSFSKTPDGDITKPVIYQDAIQKILSSKLSAGLPLFVVSITGVYRSGKSFLTNIFISYLKMLEDKPKTIAQWLSSDQTFSDVEWARGVDSVTQGIWMTSEPYIIANQKGEKVAVLVMDCQGIYDVPSSNETSDAIVTLLAMEMSSVHVINVSGDINASDLAHIEASVTYSTTKDTNPLFNYLLLLHRNWDSVGELGAGSQYFKTVASERCLTQTEENIIKAFKNHSEFMLPTPGENVRKASSTCCLQELVQDEETKKFFDYTERLCSWLFTDLAFEQEYRMSRENLLLTVERFKELLADENIPLIQSQSQLMSIRAIMHVYYDLEENHFPQLEKSIIVQAGVSKETLEEDIQFIRQTVRVVVETKRTEVPVLAALDETSIQIWRKVDTLIDDWLTNLARLKEAERKKAESSSSVRKTAAAVGGVVALSALSGGAGLVATGAVMAFEVGVSCALTAAAGEAAMGAVGSGVVGTGVALYNWITARKEKEKKEEVKKEV